MNDSQAHELLDGLISAALKSGADAADAVIFRSVSSGVSWRLGNLEDLDRSESRDLGLRVFIGKRQAAVSTTDLSIETLPQLVERAVSMARAAPEDPYCGLAPADRLARPPYPDLDLGDFTEPDTETLKARAAACEEAAMAVKGVINSEGAGAGYGEGARWFATSAGFFGATRSSHHSLSVSVIARDSAGMERDYDWESKTHLGDMRSPEEIGARAGRRAAARLSPRKLKSRPAPVIFDKRISDSLLGALSRAANGAAIARGVSFLKDRMGTQIFAPGIDVIDDPFIRRGYGSRPFDGEGVAGVKFNLIEDGALCAWFLNAAQARQLGLETNGRATRGTGGPPGSASTNLYLQNGRVSPAQLLKDTGDGLLLTETFGPQINPNTGDYSVGCAGFWFENGEIAHPASEITVAGNLLDMFRAVVPANDLEFIGSINAPTLYVGQMTIAGD